MCARQSTVNEGLLSAASSCFDSSHLKTPSLADQYLDTMKMDDSWRAACYLQIRNARKVERALKRLKGRISFVSQPRPSKVASTVLSAPRKKAKQDFNNHSVSAISGRDNASASVGSSDSGYFSGSPPPNSQPTLDTDSIGISRSITSIVSFDPLPERRRCLSCKSPETSCWRHALGGIICNSCGLRFNHSCRLLIKDTGNVGSYVQMPNVVMFQPLHSYAN